MTAKIRKAIRDVATGFATVGEWVSPAVPHVMGLTGFGVVVWGVSGWLGPDAGAILAGLPFAGFWIWGEALKVIHNNGPRE